MRRKPVLVLLAMGALSALPAFAQTQPAPTAQSAPAAQVVEPAGANVSSPRILSSVPPQYTDEGLRARYEGVCIVSLVVDAEGNPQDVHVPAPIGMGLDEEAVKAVRQFKFKPAIKDGVTPVATRFTVTVKFQLPGTVERPETVNGRVSAPIPVKEVVAEFSDEARRALYSGACLVSVIVDTQGVPQNVRVVRALGMGLDEKAVEAVKQFRFKPALKDGKTPVAVRITVEVNFRLQDTLPSQVKGIGPVEQIGGRVSRPILVKEVSPEYTNEARRARYQGVDLVSLIVDAKGRPQHVQVARSLGMGLDEKAVEAVKKFRFKPALIDGKTPVAVFMTIEVNFHLY